MRQRFKVELEVTIDLDDEMASQYMKRDGSIAKAMHGFTLGESYTTMWKKQVIDKVKITEIKPAKGLASVYKRIFKL